MAAVLLNLCLMIFLHLLLSPLDFQNFFNVGLDNFHFDVALFDLLDEIDVVVTVQYLKQRVFFNCEIFTVWFRWWIVMYAFAILILMLRWTLHRLNLFCVIKQDSQEVEGVNASFIRRVDIVVDFVLVDPTNQSPQLGVIMIFYRVVSASRYVLCNFGPLVSVDFVSLHKHEFFVEVPVWFSEAGVKLIVPSFSALLAVAHNP